MYLLHHKMLERLMVLIFREQVPLPAKFAGKGTCSVLLHGSHYAPGNVSGGAVSAVSSSRLSIAKGGDDDVLYYHAEFSAYSLRPFITWPKAKKNLVMK